MVNIADFEGPIQDIWTTAAWFVIKFPLGKIVMQINFYGLNPIGIAPNNLTFKSCISSTLVSQSIIQFPVTHGKTDNKYKGLTYILLLVKEALSAFYIYILFVIHLTVW